MSDLQELAAECERCAVECTQRACKQPAGSGGSMEWIAEAANYFAVAKALRDQVQA